MSYEKACEVICAVADRDREAVNVAIGNLDRATLQSLTVMLAAMVPAETGRTPASVLKARAAHLQMTADLEAPSDLAVAADHVSAMCGISLEALYGPSRNQAVTEARQVLCWVARTALGLSLSTIGRHVGRDHTTVLHAVRRVTNDAGMRAKASIVVQLLGADSETVAVGRDSVAMTSTKAVA
ncbi:MAG TPA: helix-turn-helix domain-containing protein [Propionibacteriaceae bacterium]